MFKRNFWSSFEQNMLLSAESNHIFDYVPEYTTSKVDRVSSKMPHYLNVFVKLKYSNYAGNSLYSLNKYLTYGNLVINLCCKFSYILEKWDAVQRCSNW